MAASRGEERVGTTCGSDEPDAGDGGGFCGAGRQDPAHPADQDFFSGKMQQDIVRLMHSPKITYISGGHLSTVLRADAFVRAIQEFLKELG